MRTRIIVIRADTISSGCSSAEVQLSVTSVAHSRAASGRTRFSPSLLGREPVLEETINIRREEAHCMELFNSRLILCVSKKHKESIEY